jgi:Winged helix DNA-binding domain
VQASMASYNRRLGLDRVVVRKSHQVLERALRDGAQLTRTELRAALRNSGLPVSTGQHAGNLLMLAEVDRVVISGARRGNQFTYALFDERVPAAPSRDREEALGELASRYFATRSPATTHDFAWWSGLTMGDARRAIAIAGRALVRENHDDREYWSGRSRGARRWTRRAHLLPNYDESFIGFKDRSAFAQRLGGVVTKAGVDALMGHVLFVDDQIVGGWRRTLDKIPTVDLRLLVPLTMAERRLVHRAVERLGRFLGVAARSRVRVIGLSDRRAPR